MRILFVILLLNISLISRSQSLTQRCINALEYINAGYIQFGVEELKKISALNSLEAQYFLGICHEQGFVVKQSNVDAFRLIRKSAERGLPDAMYRLSLYYQNGFAVTVNENSSAEWLKRYQAKGGEMLLPDISTIIKEGTNHPENYALNPNVSTNTSGEGNILATNVNINSNNIVGARNQTIKNITSVPMQSQPIIQPQTSTQPTTQKSDVDQNIPISTQRNEDSFALIIANENYQDVAKVSNALNDGEVFSMYCQKTLGLPTSNVIFIKDATFNNIKREINKLSQIAIAYNGAAKIIFYYAGHGIPNETTRDAYLLPVDGCGSDTSTGYSLKELYGILGNLPAQKVIVLLDACFSGSQRGNGTLASARGVAIKAKPNKAAGKMVVLSAAQGDETAYPYKEQNHGLFTYYLLKKLQESKGEISLGDLSSYIKDNVSKKSIVVNGKSQTPSVNPSDALGDTWTKWTLK